MNQSEFRPDPDLQCEVEDLISSAFNDLRSDQSASDRAATFRAIFECLGTYEFLGILDNWFENHPLQRNQLQAAVPAFLKALNLDEVDKAAMDIVFLSEALRGAVLEEQTAEPSCLDAAQDHREKIAYELIDSINVRHRLELALAGAAGVLGTELVLLAEQSSKIEAFDEIVSENLWRTLYLGEQRAAMCIWAQPEMRSRLWWWSRGIGLPANALAALETTAQVLFVFPKARAELEKMITAEKHLKQMVD